MRRRIGQFFISEKGATSIEYAIIASMISIVIFFAAVRIGTSVHNLYQRVADSFPK